MITELSAANFKSWHKIEQMRLAPFTGREAIMSGSPRRMADSFVQAFVRR